MSDSLVLVTGSSGTIGTALVETLLDNGMNVRGIDCHENRWSKAVDEVTTVVDLTEPKAIGAFPTADIVVHLAAHSRVRELVREPKRSVENVLMTETVLSFARETNAGVIFTSSREVYGDQDQTVYEETDARIDRVENPYGASKVSCESLLAAYSECYELSTATLRLSNVYGRYDVTDRVIPLFIALATRGEDLTVYGGEKLLDFLYLDDCLRVIIRAIEQFEAVQGETLNVGRGRGTSLVELAELIASRIGSDINVVVEPNRRGEVNRYVADIDRTRRLLEIEPQYSLAEGLDETVEWYLDHRTILDEIV